MATIINFFRSANRLVKSCFLIGLFALHTVVWANIVVQLDHSQVKLGETFHLIFNIKDPGYQGVPDLTPLQKNFTIIGTERSVAYSIVNGQTHTVNQWIVLLSPKKIGTLPIPALTLGTQQTVPTQVEVVASQNQASSALTDEDNPQGEDADDNVMLKTEVNPQEVYVNQQIIYTIRLYNSQQLMDADYQPPRVEDALLVPFGSGRRYQTLMNKRQYVVEEQQYAIFPQKSGRLKIIAPTFRALVFDAQPQRITRHPKPTFLSVKAIPSSMKGKSWLPAKQLSLTETYSQTDLNLKQGTTLSRTVTLQAAGAPAELLPVLNFVCKDDFSCYPEKSNLQNTAHQQTLIGRSETKVTYLFNKPGSVTLPAIEVPWFNTETKQIQTAVLPARTFIIEGAGEKVASKRVLPSLEPTQTKRSIPVEQFHASTPLAWWLALGFALAWVITLIIWWVMSHSRPEGRRIKRQALQSVEQACLNNDATACQDALLRWARLNWPDVTLLNLHQLSQMIADNSVRQALKDLSQVRYSAKPGQKWEGRKLWHALQIFLRDSRDRKKSKKAPTLPPINP